MESTPEPVAVCLVTRYCEYIDWIQYIPQRIDTIYIYNKGPNDMLFKQYVPTEQMLKKIKIIKYKNIGRIDHTLAYHILEHWDVLPDIIISLPGTVMMSENKGRYFSSMVKKFLKIKNNYGGFYGPRFRRVDDTFNYSGLVDYQVEGICNRNSNKFVKSEYPDFKTWKLAVVDDKPMKYIAMRGMFVVCKENILHIDKQIYSRLLESLSVGDNIENGHFAERVWAHLFTQYSFNESGGKQLVNNRRRMNTL